MIVISATAALSAASQVPIDYVPDPALKTASMGELEARIGRACMVTQARLQNRPEAALRTPCGCYASRTLRAMTAAELAAYRNTGYFDDTTRVKAIAAIDACRLQRPF